MIMNKETLESIVDEIKEKDRVNEKILNKYEIALEENLVNACNSVRFPNSIINEVELNVVPIGDYVLGTHYDKIYPLHFLIAYKIDKKYVNYQIIKNTKKRLTKSGKIYDKLTTQTSVNAPSTSDIAENLTYFLKKELLTIDDKIVQKRHKILINFDNELMARIDVVYDFDGITNSIYGSNLAKFNYELAQNNFNEKNTSTNGNYFLICKLMKAFEVQLLLEGLSVEHIGKKPLLTETLLYNVPDELMKGDDLVTILHNSLNFMYAKDIENFVTLDEKYKMFSSDTDFDLKKSKTYIRKVIYCVKNFDLI